MMKKLTLTTILALIFIGNGWSETLDRPKMKVSEVSLMSIVRKYKVEPEFTICRIGG